MAWRPPRRRSASRVYRSASASVVWPSTAMISCAVAPSSANRRPRVFRKPWGLQSIGNPAALIACRMNCGEAGRGEWSAKRRVDDGDVISRGMVESAAQVGMKIGFDAHSSLAPRVGDAQGGLVDLAPGHPVYVSTRGTDVEHQAV